MEYIAAIISTLGAVIMAFFTYNQYAKNKKTDMKIEQYKAQLQARSKRRSDNSAHTFGALWNLLHDIGCDRAYIIQPHPLGNESMLTVYYEVRRNGIESIKPHIHELKMSDVAKFSEMLAKNLFLYITDIDKQIEDKYAKSILMSAGCKSVAIKRLSDNRHDWVGSLTLGFTDGIDQKVPEQTEEFVRNALHDAANNIQFLLPEIEEKVEV